jgi:hypothetical protein
MALVDSFVQAILGLWPRIALYHIATGPILRL